VKRRHTARGELRIHRRLLVLDGDVVDQAAPDRIVHHEKRAVVSGHGDLRRTGARRRWRRHQAVSFRCSRATRPRSIEAGVNYIDMMMLTGGSVRLGYGRDPVAIADLLFLWE